MFRLGGSTSGITSGLDKPKRGRVDGPGGYAGIDYDKAYETSQRITDKYYPRRGADINRFLIDWGLNMVGNPPSGNVLQTAAKQAQGPTKELFAGMDQRDATRSAVGAGLFGEIIGAEGKMMGEGKLYKDQVMLDALVNATKEKIRITKLLETEEDKVAIENLENELIVHNTTIAQIKKRNPLVDRVLGSTAVVKELLDVILPSYDKMMIKDEESGENVLKYPKTPEGQEQKIQDAMKEIIRIIQSGASGAMAKGGDVFVLDMGDPIKILDLAYRMIHLSGLKPIDTENPNGDIKIKFTGLRPGEKLYEELLIGDNVNKTVHKKILRAEENFMPWNQVENLLKQLEEAENQQDISLLKNILKEAISGYQHKELSN